MRLEHLTPAHVRRAVETYLLHAWPKGSGKPRITVEDLEGLNDLESLFGKFERGGGRDEDSLERYTLRLGNTRYPFMKFVVQEFLINGEYFFSVDTHDNLDIRAGNPDYEEWERLKEWNRELKRTIEKGWDRAGLPTNSDLRALVEEVARVEREGKKRKRLLLVDDETDVVIGLQALLRARGYQVEVLHNGVDCLERLGRDPLPDLVLLDYEMPELDGEEVLDCLRAEKRTCNLPVLMATASNIQLDRVQKVSGLLRKPYPRHVLFEMIKRLLGE
ncbi:MAG: response regulator [Planctomycetota bacterium]|nr:response regulator [Planctomycetota bacterium]